MRLVTILLTLLVSLLPLKSPAAQSLLSDSELGIFSEEISGEIAKRNLEFISRNHRMRGSEGYLSAAQFIEKELRKYGISEVKIEEFPADGKIFYGTQKSRPAWDVELAELWEMHSAEKDNVPGTQIASWEAIPMSLAQDSESAEVTAELIDVGKGTSDADYKNRDVRGKIVLTSEQPEAAAAFAVEKFGAAGMVSYAQNQRTAWWGENENLVRWGHLDTFAKKPSFAFMVSLKQARSFQKRLAAGEKILLHAKVRAGKHNGNYQVVNAVIPGSDSKLKDDEIVFSCHLDHPRPGANDNASGCVAILEVARVFAALIADGKIERPARTIRFVWPPEIEGTLALLNGRPEIAARTVSAIHMDMVGGSSETQALFHITRGPASMPSFIFDVVDSIGQFVNEQTDEFASTGSAKFSLHSPEGEKRPLQAQLAQFSMGSDHQIYMDSSFGIPSIYFNDWPDRYIHTTFDIPGNIDPTKLKRAAFLGATTAYFLTNIRESHAGKLWKLIQAASLKRTAELLRRISESPDKEKADAIRFHLWHERALFQSTESYFRVSDQWKKDSADFIVALRKLIGDGSGVNETSGDSATVFVRNPQLKGPMEAFGYGYLEDKYGSEKVKSLRLLKHQGHSAEGSLYAYDALNFVNGERSVHEITNLLSGAYGSVPVEDVLEYLRALESIGVVSEKGR